MREQWVINLLFYYLFFTTSCATTKAFCIKNKHNERTIQITYSRKNKKFISWDIDDEYNEESRSPFTSFYENENNSQQSKLKEIFIPRSVIQRKYYESINYKKFELVIACGPAGTGKTLLPTQQAAKILIETDQKVVLTRPLISVDEEIGYLPGNINQKMDPWIIPIFDVLLEFFTQKELNIFIAEKRLEIVPLAFMRGRTFKNTFIIGDELQNTSNKQMLMLLTRLGENSKMIITGDISQCDNTENGLKDLLSKLKTKYDTENNKHFKNDMENDGISMIELTSDDIQRSNIVSTILDIYDN